jgi:hypothetical protein
VQPLQDFTIQPKESLRFRTAEIKCFYCSMVFRKSAAALIRRTLRNVKLDLPYIDRLLSIYHSNQKQIV